MKAKLKEIALYYGVGTSTMRRWLAVADIKTPLGRRMYTPKEMLINSGRVWEQGGRKCVVNSRVHQGYNKGKIFELENEGWKI